MAAEPGPTPGERLGCEIRGRTDVDGSAPTGALIRVVSAVQTEQHDEWTGGRLHLGPHVLAVRPVAPSATTQPAMTR